MQAVAAAAIDEEAEVFDVPVTAPGAADALATYTAKQNTTVPNQAVPFEAR
jgi:hypothetical protein